MIDRRAALGMGAGVTLLPLSATAQRGDPVAIGKGGRGRGVREGGWSVFRGIRYGADMTRRRFQAPVALPLARDILLATAFGPSCPQRGGSDLTQAKDCWFLDIWTPDARAGANHPVIFPQRRRFGRTVIEPLVFGQHWAPRDVVVATVNHRLNALGYLYFDRLATRFADSGNAGQPDLILALQWARDNITGFDGNADRMMVFGQSGGDAKIATLMAMPAARGLCHSTATMSERQATASGPINATGRLQACLARRASARECDPADSGQYACN